MFDHDYYPDDNLIQKAIADREKTMIMRMGPNRKGKFMWSGVKDDDGLLVKEGITPKEPKWKRTLLLLV